MQMPFPLVVCGDETSLFGRVVVLFPPMLGFFHPYPGPAMTTPPPTNLVTLDRATMTSLVARLDWPSYRTRQILQWIYQHRIRDIAGMSNLSHQDRETLGHEGRH